MSITAFIAYLAMAYIVWFYLLTPHVELLEDAVWQLTKSHRGVAAPAPVTPAAVAAPAEKSAPVGQRPPAQALQLRAA